MSHAPGDVTGEIPIKAFANMPNLAWLSMTDNPGLAGTSPFFLCKPRTVSNTIALLGFILPLEPACTVQYETCETVLHNNDASARSYP